MNIFAYLGDILSSWVNEEGVIKYANGKFALVGDFKVTYRNNADSPYIEVRNEAINGGCGSDPGLFGYVSPDELNLYGARGNNGEMYLSDDAVLAALGVAIGRYELRKGVTIVDKDLQNENMGSIRISPHKKRYTLELDRENPPRLSLLAVEYVSFLGISPEEVVFTNMDKPPYIRGFSSRTPQTGVKLYHVVTAKHTDEEYQLKELVENHIDFFKQTKEKYHPNVPYSLALLKDENPQGNRVFLEETYFETKGGHKIMFSNELKRKDRGRIKNMAKLPLNCVKI